MGFGVRAGEGWFGVSGSGSRVWGQDGEGWLSAAAQMRIPIHGVSAISLPEGWKYLPRIHLWSFHGAHREGRSLTTPQLHRIPSSMCLTSPLACITLQALANIDTWDFNIKEMAEATDGKPLRIVGWHLLNDQWCVHI